jgi:hypothetical protein
VICFRSLLFQVHLGDLAVHRRNFLALIVALVISSVGSFAAFRPAHAASLTFTVTCSSVTLTITGALPGQGQDLFAYRGFPGGPQLGNGVRGSAPASGLLVLTVSFPEQPEGTVIAADSAGGIFGEPLPSVTKACGKDTNPVKFFDPGDGRVDPRPGDRLAVWCNIAGNPPSIDVWAVGDDSRGFRLATFNFTDLAAAGPQGIAKNLGRNGKLSAVVDAQNNFFVAWNGGPFGATGAGVFAKSFHCAFKR